MKKSFTFSLSTFGAFALMLGVSTLGLAPATDAFSLKNLSSFSKENITQNTSNYSKKTQKPELVPMPIFYGNDAIKVPTANQKTLVGQSNIGTLGCYLHGLTIDEETGTQGGVVTGDWSETNACDGFPYTGDKRTGKLVSEATGAQYGMAAFETWTPATTDQEYIIPANIPNGEYRLRVRLSESPQVTTLSSDIIYINSAPEIGDISECLEIERTGAGSVYHNNITTYNDDISIASFSIENDCDFDVEFEELSFEMISGFDDSIIDELDVYVGNEQVGTLDYEVEETSSNGKIGHMFEIEGNNGFDIEEGDMINITLKAELDNPIPIGHTTAFAVALEDYQVNGEFDETYAYSGELIWGAFNIVNFL